MWARLAQTKLRNSIIWEFEEEFDYRMFDCVRLAQRFRWVRLPNPIDWVRLPAIPNIRRESMRSSFCRKNQVKHPRSNALSDLTPRDTKSMSFLGDIVAKKAKVRTNYGQREQRNNDLLICKWENVKWYCCLFCSIKTLLILVFRIFFH